MCPSGAELILPAIAALLKEKTGLDATAIGQAAIERAVRERMAAGSLPDTQAYWQHLRLSEEEQQRLIEAVVVSETWFFRHREAFVALGRIVSGEWLAAHPSGLLRVLSAACATGEEPYSVAMALLDCGLSPERFRIDALDISTHAIAHAREGVYGRNSFRGSDLAFRDRYFQHTPKGYRVSTHVRDLVRLRSANLFAPGAFSSDDCYDVVFCRNVLIYFDRSIQRRGIEILRNLMAADGVIFVGPAEAALVTESGLTPARMPHAFAFRRAHEASAAPCARPPPKARQRPLSAQAQRSRRWSRAANRLVPAVPSAPAPPNVPCAAAASEIPWMVLARQLADQGKLAQALDLCEQGLRESPRSAQVFYLLGLLHDAAARPQRAAENYRKAVYLDPTHEEALLHLATLLKGEGDVEGAARLFDRARRLRAAGES
jgi:chemotaxis protein methyltransferase WspC